MRVTVSVCLHGIRTCGTSRRGHDFLWHLRREAEARHPVLKLARSLFQRLFLLFTPLFWTAVEAGWQAIVGGSTASTVFLEIRVASQGNRPAHVTLKALDWVSISCASWYPPKMTQHSQIQGAKQNVCFQTRINLTWVPGGVGMRTALWGSQDLWSGSGWEGHVKWAYYWNFFGHKWHTCCPMIRGPRGCCSHGTINGVNMGYKKSSRGVKKKRKYCSSRLLRLLNQVIFHRIVLCCCHSVLLHLDN